MAKSRLSTLHAILRPKVVWLGGFIIAAVAAYDSFSNQFPKWHLPKLGDLLPSWAGMTGALLPWWGWLLILQSLFLYALFEYVRITVSSDDEKFSVLSRRTDQLNQRLQRFLDDPPNSNRGASAHSLADNDTRRMAGNLTHLGEVVRQFNWRGAQPHTTQEMYFSNLHNSTHVIWTRSDARQLRRDFQNQVGRIIETNKKLEVTEHATAVAEMDKTIAALTAILLGNS